VDAAGDAGADGAGGAAASLAVQRLRGGDRDETLTDAGWTSQDQAGRQRSALDGPRQQADEPAMADNVSKCQ